MTFKKTLAGLVLSGAMALGLGEKQVKGDFIVTEPATNVPMQGPGLTSYVTQNGKEMFLTTSGQGILRSSWDAINSGWTYPQNIGFPSNSRDASLSPDEELMFYFNGGIYVTTKLWGKWIPGGIPIPDAPYLNPFFSGNRLYFYYTPVWGGGYEVGYKEFLPDDSFGPTKLLTEINTPYHEQINYISPDHQIMLFSSNRPGSYGGMDLYKADWNENTSKWENPTNLGPYVNSPSNEGGAASYSPTTNILYFNRGEIRMQAPVIPEPQTLSLFSLDSLVGFLAKRKKQ